MWLTHPVLILGVAVLLSAPGRAGIAATEDGRLLSNLQLNKRILLAERRSLFIDDEDYGIMSSGSGDHEGSGSGSGHLPTVDDSVLSTETTTLEQPTSTETSTLSQNYNFETTKQSSSESTTENHDEYNLEDISIPEVQKCGEKGANTKTNSDVPVCRHIPDTPTEADGDDEASQTESQNFETTTIPSSSSDEGNEDDDSTLDGTGSSENRDFDPDDVPKSSLTPSSPSGCATGSNDGIISDDFCMAGRLQTSDEEHELRMEILRLQVQTAKFNRDEAEIRFLIAKRKLSVKDR